MQLELQQLSISIRSNNILRDVVAVFGPGLHAITGRNGSGKSTLLKALAGILPATGTIRYNDQDLSANDTRARARILGYLPQRISTDIPLNVYDFLLLGRIPHLGFSQTASRQDHTLIQEALKQWALQNFTNRRMDQLSGGELQRVQLCRLTVQDCPIWLLDEPSTFLDYAQKAALYQHLSEQAHTHIILCVSHDLAELLPIASSHHTAEGGLLRKG